MIDVAGTPVAEVVATVGATEMIVVIGGIMATRQTRATKRGDPRRLSGPGASWPRGAPSARTSWQRRARRRTRSSCGHRARSSRRP
eukprot:6018630-Pyramimonas_sp.AAC.1